MFYSTEEQLVKYYHKKDYINYLKCASKIFDNPLYLKETSLKILELMGRKEGAYALSLIYHGFIITNKYSSEQLLSTLEDIKVELSDASYEKLCLACQRRENLEEDILEEK